jgi:hypothetical protein
MIKSVKIWFISKEEIRKTISFDILNDNNSRQQRKKKMKRNTVKQKSNSSTGTGSDIHTHKIGHQAKPRDSLSCLFLSTSYALKKGVLRRGKRKKVLVIKCC